MSTDEASGQGVHYEAVIAAALGLPEVEEGLSYGTPALKVRGKLMVRLREDEETLVLKTGWEDREELMNLDPETFFLTDHYRGYPCVLVRLSTLAPEALPSLLEAAWREVVPRSLVSRYDAQQGETLPDRGRNTNHGTLPPA